VARDAAVVWHGFTQMAGYAGSSPLVVEHAGALSDVVPVDGPHFLAPRVTIRSFAGGCRRRCDLRTGGDPDG